MQENSRETCPYQMEEKEIDLRKLAKTLKERRRFIFGFTGIVTLLAILYVLSLPPLAPPPINHKVTTSFIKPSESSVLELVLNKSLKVTSTSMRNSIYASFLNNIIAQPFQKKVFTEGAIYPDLTNKTDQ